MEKMLAQQQGKDYNYWQIDEEKEVANLAHTGIDRKKIIQEIIAVLVTLERCSDQEIENVKRFLRWMPDDALQDMKDKYREALEKRQDNC